MKKRIIGDDRKRLLSKIEVPLDPDGCWLFTGAKSSTGYGNFYMGGRYFNAHRAAWLLLVGPIAEGLEVDHLCHSVPECRGGKNCQHRICVNPNHLLPVPRRENDLRGAGVSATNAVKTHCLAGHAFTEANTYRNPKTKPENTHRECRICHRDRVRRDRAARKNRFDSI